MENRLSFKKLVIVGLMILGLGIGVYLVQKVQLFKSRAGSPEQYGAFGVSTQEPGKKVTCNGDQCQTDTLHVEIKLNDLTPLK